MDLFQKFADERKTNQFDSEKATTNREKTKVCFSFGTKARSKGFDLKKNEVLTLLSLTGPSVLEQTWKGPHPGERLLKKF